MISHNDPKFIFIHLPKNAGSSVTKALSSYLGVEREKLRYGKYKFIYARDLNRIVSDVSQYFTFAVIRNPWDRVVSYFHYLQQIRQPPHNLDKNVKFEDWVLSGGFRTLQTQMSQLADEFPCNVSTHIDYIVRIESMQEDWNEVCKRMGIDCPLNHDKKSDHTKYIDYYNDMTKDIIYKHYKNDVDCLSYYFGDK
mgnify:FL=1|jgi:chondroitin 4-sulfotransferase 11